jgi:hypothetical protein
VVPAARVCEHCSDFLRRQKASAASVGRLQRPHHTWEPPTLHDCLKGRESLAMSLRHRRCDRHRQCVCVRVASSCRQPVRGQKLPGQKLPGQKLPGQCAVKVSGRASGRAGPVRGESFWPAPRVVWPGRAAELSSTGTTELVYLPVLLVLER